MDWYLGGTLILVGLASWAVGWGFDSVEKAAGFVIVLVAALTCIYKGFRGLVEREQKVDKVPILEETIERYEETFRKQEQRLRVLEDQRRDLQGRVKALERGLQDTTEWRRETPRLPKYPTGADEE